MIINKHVVFRPTYNSDSTEGRGHTINLDFCFEEKEDALKFVTSEYYAKNYGVWNNKGSEYDIKEVEVKEGYPFTVKIYKSYEEFKEDFQRTLAESL